MNTIGTQFDNRSLQPVQSELPILDDRRHNVLVEYIFITKYKTYFMHQG